MLGFVGKEDDGDKIFFLEAVTCRTPKSTFEMTFFANRFKMHSNTYDFNVPYTSVKSLHEPQIPSERSASRHVLHTRKTHVGCFFGHGWFFVEDGGPALQRCCHAILIFLLCMSNAAPHTAWFNSMEKKAGE